MSKLKGKNYFGFQAQIKSVEQTTENEVKKVTIKGFASTPQVDRYSDIVEPKAFSDALETYMSNPVILFGHNPDDVIGLAVEGKVTDKGLYITAEITEDGSKETEVAMTRILQGKLKTLSIGYQPLEVRFQNKETGDEITDEAFYTLPWDAMKSYLRKITKLDLVEISVVSTPANPGALFDVAKSIKSFLDERESIIKGAHMSEVEEKELYLITADNMKKKNIEKKNASEEEVKEKKSQEEVEDEYTEDDEEKEKKSDDETEGENADDSKAAEKSGESPDKDEEVKAENADGEESDDEGDDEPVDVQPEEGAESDDEEEMKTSASDLKSILTNLGEIYLDAKDKKGTETFDVKLKDFIDLKDKKAVASALKGLLEMNVKQQKTIETLTKKLDITPDKKVLITSKHYQRDSEMEGEGKKKTDQKKTAGTNALKSIFAAGGVQLRD